MNSLGIDSFLFALREEISFYRKTGEPIPDITNEGESKIEAYLMMPFQTGFGKELYPDVYDKASILFYLIIKNHPLENGNKRMAIVAMILFLKKNKIDLKIDGEELYELSKFVAMSDPENKDKILEHIKLKIKSNMKIAKKTKIESLKAIIADKTLDESFRASASEKLAALESEPVKKKMKTSSIVKDKFVNDVLMEIKKHGVTKENADKIINDTLDIIKNKESHALDPEDVADYILGMQSVQEYLPSPKKSNKADMKPTKSALETAKEKSKTKKVKAKIAPKTFIYKKEVGGRSRTSGSSKLTFTVYEIKNNKPDYIGETTASSGSYKGDYSTVMNFLAKEKRIPDNFTDYYRESEAEGIFTIMEL